MNSNIVLFIAILLTLCPIFIISDNVKNNSVTTLDTKNNEVAIILSEFNRLSSQNNIVFDKKVTISFSKIDKKRTLGNCTYGKLERSINLDIGRWESATWLSKTSLIYHEKIHCSCGRLHDFGENKFYPDGNITSILNILFKKISILKSDGYFLDLCPLSIMDPVLLDDKCFSEHYQYYIKEMFNRCKPY